MGNKVEHFVVIYLMLLAYFLFALSSCSPQWHVSRAISKDPTVLKVKIDTVNIKTIEYIDSVKGVDSLIVDNNEVYIKVKSINDSIDFIYKVKERVFDTLIRNKVIDVQPKITRQDKRLNAKQERIETKRNARVKIVTEKQKNKPKEKTTFFKRLWIKFRAFLIFIIGLFLGILACRIASKLKLF